MEEGFFAEAGRSKIFCQTKNCWSYWGGS